jgi:hypothetical protein
MFHCTRCKRAFSAERQKGLKFYRCHTKGCIKGGLREETIEAKVSHALKQLVVTAQQAKKLQQQVRQWTQTVLKSEPCPS